MSDPEYTEGDRVHLPTHADVVRDHLKGRDGVVVTVGSGANDGYYDVQFESIDGIEAPQLRAWMPESKLESADKQAVTDGGGIKIRAVNDAGDSRDSALQYLAADILDSGGDPALQESLIAPVEAEIHELDYVFRDNFRTVFRDGAVAAAEAALDELAEELTYADVPEEHRASVREHVEEHLAAKVSQLAEAYETVSERALRQAERDAVELTAEWGTVV